MKNSKVPLWPLYAADALMFLLVIAVAIPSAARGESIGVWQTFFCCLMVLAGMFLALLPYLLEYKQELAQKHEHTEEARKNFEIIFDELASLRLALADLVERVEKDEDAFASLPVLEKGLIELRDSVKKKFQESADSADSLAANITKAESAQKSLKQTVEEIGADIVVIRELFGASQESSADELAQIRKEISALKESGAYSENKKTEDENGENPREIDELAEEEENSFSPAKIITGSLMKRALGNSKDTKSAVEKFVSRAQSDDTPDDDFIEPFDQDGTKLGDFEPPSDEIPGEEDNPQNNEENSPSEKNAEDFFEPADSPQKVESANQEKIEDTPKPASKEEAHETPSTTADKTGEDMLFDNLPESRESPVKPKKGDAVIVVNALIGIGNKPYLRGDGAGLSPDKGVPMDYIEIGKWRYVLRDFDGELHYTILKNDEVPPNGESNFSISCGQKNELNLFFPIDPV